MEPIDVIVQALLAGAAAGAKDTCSKVVRDAYEGLKSLLKGRFKGKRKTEGGLILDKLEEKPRVWEAPIKDCLDEIEVDKDIELIKAAKRILDLLQKEGASKEMFAGDFREAQGAVQAREIGSITQFIGDRSKDKSGRDEKSKKGLGASNGNGTSEGKEDFALPDDLNLSREEIDCMLWMAVQPEVKYPICEHPAVTHAAGSAVARLVISAMLCDIGDLIDRFDVTGRQISIEMDYNSDRLEEYTYDLSELKHVLVKMIESSKLGSYGQQSLIGKVFGKLREGNNILHREIIPIYRSIERKVNSMEELRGKTTYDSTKNGEAEIKRMFKETREEMEESKKRLCEVLEEIRSLTADVKTDWDRDLDKLWDRKCKPAEERKCGCWGQD